jgi:hypothetical protein
MTTFYAANGVMPIPLLVVDAVPPDLPASGQRQMLEPQGQGEVVATGKFKLVNFNTHNHILTRGLSICFAVCAVWNKLGSTFQNGFLTHLSSPGPMPPKPCNFFTYIENIPADAFVVCGVPNGRDELGNFIAAKISELRGVPGANIWVYYRPNNDDFVGFGIDRSGRFGETLGKV